MQENLWGVPEVIPLQRQPRKTAEPLTRTSLDCQFFGHTWRVVGMLGEKKCTVCGEKGYCPGCTNNPPEAHPYFCTKHTPTHESTVSG